VDRKGLNPGEGAAMLILESAESAKKRGATPLVALSGFGEALEAYHYTRSTPQGSGLVFAMRRALDSAGLQPDNIMCLHLHGTGTEANDRSEFKACSAVFGDRLASVPACSTKGATGHTFGAAGALNAVFAAISIIHGIIPATLNTERIDPEFRELNISASVRQAGNMSAVACSALGFGGESSVLILSKA
jgi:3-oxoacyl-[acyl-carrier-protein] synthase II